MVAECKLLEFSNEIKHLQPSLVTRAPAYTPVGWVEGVALLPRPKLLRLPRIICSLFPSKKNKPSYYCDTFTIRVA